MYVGDRFYQHYLLGWLEQQPNLTVVSLGTCDAAEAYVAAEEACDLLILQAYPTDWFFDRLFAHQSFQAPVLALSADVKKLDDVVAQGLKVIPWDILSCSITQLRRKVGEILGL